MAKLHWNAKDLTGQVFGRLTVIGIGESRRKHRVYWRCRCACGSIKDVAGDQLTSGDSKSCGCNQHAGHRRTHGQSDKRVHIIWLGMKQRCENPRSHAYRLYGERGIKVCERWQTFENFLADMGHPEPGLTIDRKNNDKGYSPDNCRWATRFDQARNSRRNIMVSHNGITQNLSDWARALKISSSAISRRIRELGVKVAIEGPIVRRRRGANVSA